MATHLETFLQQANSWIGAKESGGQNRYAKGSKLAEIFTTYGAAPGTAWCAVFVSACAIKAKATSVIGKNPYAPGICKQVIKNGGTWIKGPYTTKSKVIPKPGDLILYNSKSSHVSYKADGSVKAWHGTHVGIVYKVTKTQVISIEGNLGGGKCAQVKHALNAKSIGGYARPKWSKIDKGTSSGSASTGGTTNTGGTATYGGNLYNIENTRHDMTIREIGYMNTSGKLTTINTGVQISLINYTSLLGDLYEEFGQASFGKPIISTEKLKGNEKIVVDYLLAYGLNASAACGIAGNIKTDSNYNPATASNLKYGICLWTGIDAGKMRIFIGEFSWATNLSGQLDYLLGDLEYSYPELLKSLKAVEVSTNGVNEATKQFANTYRKITGSTSVATRQAVASSIFANIVTTPVKQVGKAKTITQNTCKVVAVSQTGQSALAQCIKYLEIGLCDTDMYKEWEQKGKSTNKGLATIGGSYLVSVNLNLACKVNDSIILDLNGGGTLKCIVAGGHSDSSTPIKFYRPRNSIINLRDWAITTIRQIRNFGKRTT